jgi:hypothetical protein
MRKLALSLVVALAGCGSSGVWSPSDPKSFDRSMFDARAIDAFPKEEQPYVMGHAIGVYLYGKTLPNYVSGHWLYRPGLSSPDAEVGYDWEDVLIARSGGDDGSGGAIYDDVGGVDPTHGGDPDSNDQGDPGTPGTPTGGGDDVGDTCGEIDARCGTFLDPAATEARVLARQVVASQFTSGSLSTVEASAFAQEFQRGLDAALAIADNGELAAHSEVTYVKPAAIEVGICQE